jgi:hypothetical protein
VAKRIDIAAFSDVVRATGERTTSDNPSVWLCVTVTYIHLAAQNI